MTSLTQHLDTWRERRAIRREIAAITSDEIADYALSREEFRKLAFMPAEQIARMEEMARIYGLGPARLDEDRAAQIAIALICADCNQQNRCRQAIEDGTTREEATFCPNGATYRTLAAE